MKISNYNGYVNEALSSTKNYPIVDIRQMYGLAAQAIITGTVAGTLKIQATCDNPADNATITNWTDLTGSYSVSNAGSNLWNLDATYYTYIRFVYTSSSGSGTIKINLNFKTFQ
jgi:hypothetical protein